MFKERECACWLLAITCVTTHTPAVTDVLESGRNVGALRPGRHVGFQLLAAGGQTTLPVHLLFL